MGCSCICLCCHTAFYIQLFYNLLLYLLCKRNAKFGQQNYFNYLKYGVKGLFFIRIKIFDLNICFVVQYRNPYTKYIWPKHSFNYFRYGGIFDMHYVQGLFSSKIRIVDLNICTTWVIWIKKNIQKIIINR